MIRFALLGLILALGITACGDSDARQQQVADQVTVDEFKYARLPDGTRIVTGTLHNGSSKHLNNVQLRIALYDAQNRRVSSVRVVVQDVASGADKAFREPLPVEVNAQSARLQSLMVL